MVARRTAAGANLRADTAASVTGSSGGDVLAPPPDLDGASAPDPFAARPRPGIDTGGAGLA